MKNCLYGSRVLAQSEAAASLKATVSDTLLLVSESCMPPLKPARYREKGIICLKLTWSPAWTCGQEEDLELGGGPTGDMAWATIRLALELGGGLDLEFWYLA